jgi:hypothetical protein
MIYIFASYRCPHGGAFQTDVEKPTLTPTLSQRERE